VRYQDFKEKDARLKEVEKLYGEMKDEHNKLKRRRHDEFMNGFNIISQKLKEMYRLITNGGDAELEALDALDPFSEGIQFHVRPLKKSWKQMSKLSGGEKTISSLSLIFALHHYKPSPLYCMDEIDAALDYKNVAIVGDYIKKRARNSQFLIISLRNNMFELAEKLVGIYKTFDITKTVTINPNKLKMKIMAQSGAAAGENADGQDENEEPNRGPLD
jgi:structural maintenance of chromosome 4